MNAAQRKNFDAILEKLLQELPNFVRDQLAETPVIVEDEPSQEIIDEMQLDRGEPSDLCGLHSGIPLTERAPTLPAPYGSTIYLFRGPIIRLSNGDEEELKNQIRITLLHELGHHFGFSEDDLDEMGYG